MTLSARRSKRRPVHAKTVGLLRRGAACALDIVFPSLALFGMYQFGWLELTWTSPNPDRFLVDHLLQRVAERPELLLGVPVSWMLLWSTISLLSLGLFHQTFGKWLMGLSVLQRSGDHASGLRLFLRVAASWTVPATLGLAWLWIAVSPERRGWHDQLSGTYVVAAGSKPDDSKRATSTSHT